MTAGGEVIVALCRQKQRDLLAHLTDAVVAYRLSDSVLCPIYPMNDYIWRKSEIPTTIYLNAYTWVSA